MYKTSFIKKSGNGKTGPIPVTFTESSTCPDTCDFKDNGCYAEYYRVAKYWKQVDDGKKLDNWDELCDIIKWLPKKTLWRHNVAGDLPGKNIKIDLKALDKLVRANKNKRGFTFTHKPIGKTGQELINAQAIFAANRSGFTINVSANNIAQADEYVKLGAGPVVVVSPKDYNKKLAKTPEGNNLLLCLAVQFDHITCESCGICANPDRKSIVVFPAHGSGKFKVSKIVSLRKSGPKYKSILK